jgi:hypothetical protein
MRCPGTENENTETQKDSAAGEPVDDMLLWRFDLHVRGFVGDEIKRGSTTLQIASLLLALAVELGIESGGASPVNAAEEPR